MTLKRVEYRTKGEEVCVLVYRAQGRGTGKRKAKRDRRGERLELEK